jgi:multiple sugar transport system permease protein
MSGSVVCTSRMRDWAAVTVTAIFLFPLLWTVFDSIKPASALYSKDGISLFGFMPTLANYFAVLGGDTFDAKRSILDTAYVSFAATALGLLIALPAAFAMWRFVPKRLHAVSTIVLAAWMVPPIVLIIPLLHLYHTVGLFDTHLGLILAEAAIHLPFAILVLKSFFDDLPMEIAEAAHLDGASEWIVFSRIVVPMIAGGIAATAVIFLIFCWTEFFLALFLTSFLRLVPIQVANTSNALGGSTYALSTTALVPCAIVILLLQKHLAREFSLGFQKRT